MLPAVRHNRCCLALVCVLTVWLFGRLFQVLPAAPQPIWVPAHFVDLPLTQQGPGVWTSATELPPNGRVSSLEVAAAPCDGHACDGRLVFNILEDGKRAVSSGVLERMATARAGATVVDMSPAFLSLRHRYTVSMRLDSAAADLGAPGSETIVPPQLRAEVDGSRSIYSRWRFLLKKTASPTLALIVAICLWAAPRLKLFTIALAFALLASYAALTQPVYSVLDEGAHFAYVWYLLEHGTLPLTSMVQPANAQLALMHELQKPELTPPAFPFYEAVQPPIFYAICAIVMGSVYGLVQSIAVAFFATRLVGVAMVSAAVCMMIKSYLLATERGVFARDDRIYACALGALVLTPSTLLFSYGISNDHLVTLLGALSCYALLTLSTVRLRRFHAVAMGVSAAALWCTKFTTLWFGAPSLLLLLRRYAKAHVAAFTGCFLALIVPLHVHYFRSYHAFSGASHHIDFILKIVNPTRQAFPTSHLVWGGLNSYFGGFVTDWHGGLWHRSAFAAICCFLTVGCCAFVVRALRNLKQDGIGAWSDPASACYFNILMACCCFLPFLMLIVLTVQSRIWMFTPRYGGISLGAYAMALTAGYRYCIYEPARLSVAGVLMVISFAAALRFVGAPR